MNKLKATFIKEILILLRDRAGIALLFIMPLTLVLVMTLLQDSTFKQLDEKHLEVLLVNHDADTFGLSIQEGLDKSKFFDLTVNNTLDKEELINNVSRGDYLIGIIINSNSTSAIRQQIKKNIQAQFPDEVSEVFEADSIVYPKSKIEIFFDPVLKNSYKQSIMGSLKQFTSQLEAKLMFDIYAGLFNEMLNIELQDKGSFDELIVFEENYASNKSNSIIPNSVQHNVPAWTIFAIFFIVIPLASNIIKERHSGVAARLLTIKSSAFAATFGKGLTYFIVGMLQSVLMLAMGVFILPLFGLPALQTGNAVPALFILTAFVVLAAVSYGILIGSIANSEQQSSIFGSISIVILAAIGGIWVPSFMMSNLMVNVSKISPLNWGLNAYYDIFLRNAGISDIWQNAALLFAFSLGCIIASYFFGNRKT